MGLRGMRDAATEAGWHRGQGQSKCRKSAGLQTPNQFLFKVKQNLPGEAGGGNQTQEK